MLKSRVYNALKGVLSEYIIGFKEEQLDVGLFAGEFVLKDLIINPNKVNQDFRKQNLPVRLKAGMIGIVKINVNFFNTSL